MGLWDDLKKNTQQATAKAVELKEVAKLTLDVSEKERQLDKLYAQLGKEFFESSTALALSSFPETAGVIAEQLTAIKEKKEQIKLAKGCVPCAFCGELMAHDDIFCQACGSRRKDDGGSTAVICPQCGKQIMSGRFCTHCGADLTEGML